MAHEQWMVDPTEWALAQSAWRRELPDAFCPEVGRRLLLAQLEFSEWILRRVEKVQFERDRSVSREIAIDLLVREDAPVFVDRDGRHHWLVPLSSMRRRTLVNLDLRDEHGESLTMPGIRLTQQLDQAMLLAAAALTPGRSPAQDEAVRQFVRTFVAGRFEEVNAAVRLYRGKEGPLPAALEALKDNPAFETALSRLRRNFTLYAFLPVSAGRHRLLRLAFDEPTDWRYRVSSLSRRADGTWRYKAGARLVSWREPSHVLAAFALKPTRLRLQVPGAENAASYHFEITAPHGLRIVQATLLAGRPNDPKRHVSEDRISGHSPTIGLHAVEIPNGSLCRVQVDLRVYARGWLNTMAVSSVAVLGVLLSVLYHLTLRRLDWDVGQVTNIVLLLVSTAAGVATLVAQREVGGVAARMVARLRALGAISTALPIFAAGFLAYATYPLESTQLAKAKWAVAVLCLVALAVTAVSVIALWGSQRSSLQSVIEESPWDMTVSKPQGRRSTDFNQARAYYGFDSPAVAIRSAEGWHERYGWTDDLQRTVTGQLTELGKQTSGAHFAACALAGRPCPQTVLAD